MSSHKKTPDSGRLSIYNINTNNIQLTKSEIQLKNHTGYNEDHLKRLKYLYQQIIDSNNNTLDIKNFESAARSICQSLTESNKAHDLAEILFKAYDKNSSGSIDFSEMIDFVWTVIDAPYEEQIVGLYQSLADSKGKLSKERLTKFILILKEHFQINNFDMKTDEDIQERVNECFNSYKNSINGLDFNQIIDYFFHSNQSLSTKIKTRWNDRVQRRNKKIFNELTLETLNSLFINYHIHVA